MNADIFAEWLRRQGHHVVRTPSSYWYEAGSRVYQAFPYHWIIEPTEDELCKVLVENRAIALRYSTPVSAPQGKISYHVVCEDPEYQLSKLRRQTRQNVKRGLAYATLERIPISRLNTEGWALRKDSLERQGRTGAETEAWWSLVCNSAEDLEGFEAWAMIHDGQIVASFLAFCCDDCYTLPFEQSLTAHIKFRVNNAIFYQIAHDAIRREGISSVFFCLDSLDAPASMDEFKFRMGMTPKPVRQRVVFHPWLAPFANRFSHGIVARLLKRNPGSYVLAKADGMLRFHQQGKYPLSEQDWPKRLEPYRAELIEIQ